MTQRFLRHQIHTAPEQIFQIELHTEKTLRIGGAIKGHEDVDIAGRASRVAGGRAEKSQLRNTKAFCENALVFR